MVRAKAALALALIAAAGAIAASASGGNYDGRATAVCLAGSGWAVRAQSVGRPTIIEKAHTVGGVVDRSIQSALLVFYVSPKWTRWGMRDLHAKHPSTHMVIVGNVLVLNTGADTIRLGVLGSRTAGIPHELTGSIWHCLAAAG